VTRPLRLQVADGVYLVTARGNERKSIYRDAADRERFLEILAETLERLSWRCLSYCLMSNHYHLLVRTPEPNLSRGMRDLNGVYAQWFNRRHRRDGHLFQGRYLAVDELLSQLAPTRTSALERYRDLTERSDADQGVSYDGRVIDGSDDFFRLHLVAVRGSPEIAAAHLRPPRPPLRQILADASDSDAIVAAYAHGYSMPAIAQQLGLHPSTISRRLTRRRAQIKT